MRKMKIKHLFLTLVLALSGQQASADWIVDVYEGLGPYVDIDDAVTAMIAAGTPTSSGTYDVINFSQGGTFGNYGGDSLFPGSPGDLFGVHVYGTIDLFEGTNYFGINHDDGMRFDVTCCGTFISSPAPTPPINTFGSVNCSGCGAGFPFMVDIWLYENFGVASLEFFYSDADNGIGALVRTVPEPGTLGLLGLGLLGLGLARRRKTA